MVRAMIFSVALALAAAADNCDNSVCDEPEQASLIQTVKTTKNSGPGSPSLKDTDMMSLLDSLMAHPQATAKELLVAEPSVQQALLQRANEKPRRLQLLHAVMDLPTEKKLEFLHAVETSPEVGRLFSSLSKQTRLNLIDMSKADSVDTVMEAKSDDWLSGKDSEEEEYCKDWVGMESSSGLCAEQHAGACFDPDKSGRTQCLSQSKLEGDYRCPPESPQKCTFQSGHLSMQTKDADLLALLDSFMADPQAIAEELVASEPSVQKSLMQRANTKPHQLHLLQVLLDLPTDKKLELLRTAKTSPEVGRLFRSLNEQTQLKLIELSKEDSADMEASIAGKDFDDLFEGKNWDGRRRYVAPRRRQHNQHRRRHQANDWDDDNDWDNDWD